MKRKNSEKYIIAAFIAAMFFLINPIVSQVKLNNANGLLTSEVNHFYIDSDNILWLATKRGISQVENWSSKPSVINRSTSVSINGICAFEGDLLWVATNGKGIYKYNKKTREMSGYRQDILMGKNILSVDFSNGIINITIQDEGKMELNISNNSSRIQGASAVENINEAFSENGIDYAITDGLSGNKLYFTFSKDDWTGIVSDKGIDAFHNTYKTIVNIDKVSLQVNYFQKRKENILIASNSGFYCYSFTEMNPSFSEPTISLTNWTIDDEVQTSSKTSISYGEYVFSFDLDLSKFNNASELYYRLNEGEWIKTDKNVSLKDLSHGDYELEYKACNKGGYCIKKDLVSIEIDHPMKKDWIKYAGGILLIVLYTTVVVVLTRKKYKVDIDLLEKAVSKKQSELNNLNPRLKDKS